MQEIKIRYVIKLGNGKILIKIFTIDEIQHGIALVYLIKNIDDGEIISRDLFTGKRDNTRTDEFPNGKDIYEGDIGKGVMDFGAGYSKKVGKECLFVIRGA